MYTKCWQTQSLLAQRKERNYISKVIFKTENLFYKNCNKVKYKRINLFVNDPRGN